MENNVVQMLRRQDRERADIAEDRQRHPTNSDLDSVQVWIRYGIDAGFCSEVVCVQHDGTPFTEPEADRFDDGDDPCCPVLRVFDT